MYLVFSAHGLPLSLIERGDPYQRHVEETVRAVLARGGWPNRTRSLRTRAEWAARSGSSLRSPTPSNASAREGKKHLLVIPISFVTEHIETLHEINIEAREEALALGVEQFEMMPALGDSPRFIGALADLVRTALNGGASNTRPKP